MIERSAIAAIAVVMALSLIPALAQAQEQITAVAADTASASLLKVRSGEPLLAVERVTYTYGGRPVEWRRGLCTTRRHFYANDLG